MGDLLYLLKWMHGFRCMITLVHLPNGRFCAFAEAPSIDRYVVDQYVETHGSTPLRALRALAQQIRAQEEAGRG